MRFYHRIMRILSAILILSVGCVTSSIISDLTIAKEEAKLIFSEEMNDAFNYNLVLNITRSVSINIFDKSIKEELSRDFGQTLDFVVDPVINIGYHNLDDFNQIQFLVVCIKLFEYL